MDPSFSCPRPEAYNGSPSRPRPRSLLSVSALQQPQDHISDPQSTRSQGGIFPIAKPALLPWKHAAHFGRAREAYPGQQPITPASEVENPMLSDAGPQDMDDGVADMEPGTPAQPGNPTHPIQHGPLTPPDTPRDVGEKTGEMVYVTMNASAPFDPFTPPATPGESLLGLAPTQNDDDSVGTRIVPATPTPRVRFASPARSLSSEAGTEVETDFNDSVSTVSSFSEHGISRPSSPEPKTEPEPVPDLTKLSEFELWTRHYDQRIPKRARLACAQCLRLGLPCDRSMPACSRCTRRQRQLRDNALSSPTPGCAPSAINACCVPMLFTQDTERTVRPIPILKAFGECIIDLPWGADLEAAKADLEARRRAAYDAIVAADEQRAARLNWVLPRAGAALEFSGRGVEQRPDGCMVLKRTAGIDGIGKARVFAPPHPLRSPFESNYRHFAP